MKVSGQLHTLVTFPQGKGASVLIGKEAGWAAGLYTLAKRKSPCPC